MDVSVVIPIKDEKDNLPLLHDQLLRALEPTGWQFELIFVDDGSTDGSSEVLEQLALQDARVKVVQLTRNFGQTPAMRAGIDHALGEVVVTMDGDLQNDPADIPVLVGYLREGYDVVLGWRKERQDALLVRKIPSWIANWLIRRVTHSAFVTWVAPSGLCAAKLPWSCLSTARCTDLFPCCCKIVATASCRFRFAIILADSGRPNIL
jgi:glycosyltransferase involved in cell wall biosynthesis